MTDLKTGLLERDAELAALRAVVAAAGHRQGAIVVVTGAAGIGKTALVRAWLDDPGAEVRTLIGWCDDFLTSRALQPLHDVARSARGALAEALRDGDIGAVFDAVLNELDYPLAPTVVVLEDVHWADEATLDVVRYVGRRIWDLPAVLVLTYRDDEVGPDHPLTGVLGTLPAGALHRIGLHPLSRGAVAALMAGSGLDPDEVADVTGGNPFFVTELIGDEAAVPASVGDAVLARIRKLPPRAQRAVEALAIVPGSVGLDLAAALVPELSDLADAERRGVVAIDQTGIRFSHELARQAVLAAMPVTLQVAHHSRVLDHLLVTAADPARVLHHATGAGRADIVAEHGPAAATEAFRAGAHREAAAVHERVLAHAELLAPEERARLLEEHAWTLYSLSRFAEAADAARQAVALRESLPNRLALLRALLTHSRMQYMVNQPQEAFTLLHRAEALQDPGDGGVIEAELAAYRLSLFHLAANRHHDVLDQWEAAAALAARHGHTDLQIYSQVYGGGSMIMTGDDRGFALLREALDIGRRQGQLEPVARCYTNLVEFLMLARRWDDVRTAIEDACRFYDDHDFRAHRYDTMGQAARLLVQQGSWSAAEAILESPLATVGTGGVLEAIPLEAGALMAVRSGAADAESLLARAWQVASRSGSAKFLVPVACAGIEWAWMAGKPAAARPFVDAAVAAAAGTVWAGPLAWHLQLLGEPRRVDGVVAEPERTSLTGDWRAAAAGWAALAMPFEQAVELLRSGQQEPTLDALHLLDRIGAVPAARLARQQLRALGVRNVPRGPSTATRGNPMGLTDRQVEVLDLLAEGLTNAEIAERLVVSVRTVDHHVSTVLAKLGVSTRRQAAALASEVRASAP
jgi:DNA-binding CsgD family transcriptional regulator/tetratricopeptide (TPR) repeat protein